MFSMLKSLFTPTDKLANELPQGCQGTVYVQTITDTGTGDMFGAHITDGVLGVIDDRIIGPGHVVLSEDRYKVLKDAYIDQAEADESYTKLAQNHAKVLAAYNDTLAVGDTMFSALSEIRDGASPDHYVAEYQHCIDVAKHALDNIDGKPGYALQAQKGWDDVVAERRRQVTEEGWSAQKDDRYPAGELAAAGGCYALGVAYYDTPGTDPYQAVLSIWPWRRAWLKPTNPRRDLIKAAALILAEIEKIDRKAAA